MLNMHPLDAGRDARLLAASGPPAPHLNGPAAAPSPRQSSALVTVSLDEVKPEALEWIWPGRIPAGKLTLIAGDPGLGKSFLTVDIAARISRGTAFPDGAPCEPGDVLMLNVEDGLADTIRPRLDAAGADPRRVRAITGVRRPGSEYEGTFSLAEDLPRLDAFLDTYPGTRAVILDPISAILGQTDSHNNADVRALLAPLAAIAERHRVAVIGVTHLNKGGSGGSAVYRTTGSLAFPAAARAAWLVAPHPDNQDARILASMKSNLAVRPTALSFSIVGDPPRLAWSAEPIEGTADDILARLSQQDDGGGGVDPVEWLRERLALGSVRCKDINREARDVGIGEKRLSKAKGQLGLKPWRKGGVGGDGEWWMSLPANPPQSSQSPAPQRAAGDCGDSGDREDDGLGGLPV